jgi:hypothetical protein
VALAASFDVIGLAKKNPLREVHDENRSVWDTDARWRLGPTTQEIECMTSLKQKLSVCDRRSHAQRGIGRHFTVRDEVVQRAKSVLQSFTGSTSMASETSLVAKTNQLCRRSAELACRTRTMWKLVSEAA